ncbi:hypothetical protein BDY21DRAFT_8633 [Lineolata rhizophorae]|uniref:Uncharacterized protein n=1 Tax=Lineolata rhizophorae TaxID=578093 RepID=A0A6A6PFN7_9PEZI|nr:hypothetical protein BDY21DRAFT_8633 [Lineolata rhizophorae]
MTSKEDIINERQANLPLPEQPRTSSDWNSANEKTVNVGSGGVNSSATESAFREPSSGNSAVRADAEELKTHTAGADVARTAKDDLGGLPNDAVAREAKNKQGTVDTTK